MNVVDAKGLCLGVRERKVVRRKVRRNNALCACNNRVGTFECPADLSVIWACTASHILKEQTVEAGHSRTKGDGFVYCSGLIALLLAAEYAFGFALGIVFFNIFTTVALAFAAYNCDTELDVPRFIIHFNWHYCQPLL